MLKKRFFPVAAALLAFSTFSTAAFAADPAKSAPALQSLSAGVLTGFDALPSPAEIQVPLAAPERVEEKAAGGGAPAPGRDFTPKVEDKARINALMKLVSDIYNGRPLPYSQDGTTFKNKEGKLPAQPAGFYREYTLLTGDAPHTVVIGGVTYKVAPDLSARGSERVIIGGGQRIYYTPDHYANFIELKVVY